ncbi:MAG: phosphate ABC transporter permease [Lentisphaerae bacterium GWF2_45_14]|nr:MAG: phosphate ABC transporter permease [Lentisphaerae bacterium GWF2_45_14]
MNWRKIEEEFFLVMMRLASLLILAAFLAIMGTVIYYGLPALSWEMIFSAPKGGFYLGKEGGVANAIVGTFYLACGATIVSLIIGLPVTLVLNVFLKRGSKLAEFIRFSFDVLWGVPSIVYGAFGFTLMLYMGMRASLLWGIITVALVVLPAMCRAIDEVMRMIPGELQDASLSVGANKCETAFKVFARQALPGIVTATLISFGRAAGDAAAVLFTTGFTDAVPTSLAEPAATLPLAIFFQLGTPFPEVQQRAYASALILTALILLVSIAARLTGSRLSKYVIK